jgi:acetaldehyde dehydrogenase (acetylating)
MNWALVRLRSFSVSQVVKMMYAPIIAMIMSVSRVLNWGT